MVGEEAWWEMAETASTAQECAATDCPHDLPCTKAPVFSLSGGRLLLCLTGVYSKLILLAAQRSLWSQVFQMFFVSHGRIHGKTRGCKWSLWKLLNVVFPLNTEGSTMGPGEIWRLRACFPSPGALKTYANPGAGQNQVILIQ
jgi:hypothetical protein